MTVVKVDAAAPDVKVIERAARLINKGEVIVCPTDTGYALAANALDARAVARIFRIKGRSFTNPVHIAVGSIEEAERYAEVNEAARYLAGHYLPGALTLVLRKKDIVPSLLVAGLGTVGIRIPDNRIMLELVAGTGKPLTATSANISGRPTPYTLEEITAHIGEGIGNVAMVLDQGPLPHRDLSTIIDLTVSPPQLIRQGRLSWLEIREVLGRILKPEQDGT